MEPMIWIGLTLFLATGEIALPGSAPPVFIAGGAEKVWVLRQPDGQLPLWWVVDDGKPASVQLPEGVQFAAALPDGAGLCLVFQDRVSIYAEEKGRWREKGESLVFEPSLTVAQPRLDGAFIQVGARWLWPLFTKERLLVLQYQSGLQLLGEVSLPNLQQAPAWTNGEVAYVEPRPIPDGEGFSWMWDDAFMRWHPDDPGKARVHPAPVVRNMERAVGLVTDDQVFWLIHGGERGELDSFGWRLQDAEGNALARGSGILTRFDWHGESQRPGLAIWTVSQKISSQLYAAIAGRRTFYGQHLRWRDGRWQPSASLELKMGKGKGEKAFELNWTAEVNGDGEPDLVAVDEKSGVRVFASESKSTLAEEAVEFGDAPERLLTRGHEVFLAQKTGSGWTLKRLELKP